MEMAFSKTEGSQFKVGAQSYPRVGHRVGRLGQKLMVVGGSDFKGQANSRFLCINQLNQQVDAVRVKNNLNIEGFSLFTCQNTLHIWGGNLSNPGNHETFQTSNQLWALNASQFSLVKQTGSVPPPRAFHSSAFFADRFLIVYGGIDSGTLFNDWFLLDCTTNNWQQLSTNLTLPLNIDSRMAWTAGRGILLLSEIIDLTSSQVVYSNDIYDFRVTDFKTPTLQLHKITTLSQIVPQPRANAALCPFIHNACPYLALFGGERLRIHPNQVFSDCWFLNLETLTWTQILIKLEPHFGTQALFHSEKIYLIGGAKSQVQLSHSISVISLNSTTLERRVCQLCRDVYGISPNTGPSQTVRYEYQETKKVNFSGSLIQKLSFLIRNPLSAFGLLIDNSFNLNANMASIKLRRLHQDPRYFKDEIKYLQITDNSAGFSQEEILETFHSFGYKTETHTHEHKFEEELAVRKQYGVNLKLASFRLGRSCLFVTKTIEEDVFVCFFSSIPTNQPTTKNNFSSFYYFVRSDSTRTNSNNFIIIRENLKHIFRPEEYERITAESTTKLYIMDLEPTDKMESPLDSYCFPFGQTNIFSNLQEYLKSLYLSPYIGRKITLDDKEINYTEFMHKLRRGEQSGSLRRMELPNVADFFKKLLLYQILNPRYPFQEILVYQQNRLINSQTGNNLGQMYCGIIEIPNEIGVNVCKTKIEKLGNERKLVEMLEKILESKKRPYPWYQTQSDKKNKASTDC